MEPAGLLSVTHSLLAGGAFIAGFVLGVVACARIFRMCMNYLRHEKDEGPT